MEYTKEELLQMHTITTVETSYRKRFINLQVMEFQLLSKNVFLVPYIVTVIFDGAYIVDERWFSNTYDPHVVKDEEGTKVMWLDFDEVVEMTTFEMRPLEEGLVMEALFDNCPPKWSDHRIRDEVSVLMGTVKGFDTTLLPEWTFDEIFNIGGPLLCKRVAKMQQQVEDEQEHERTKNRISQFLQAIENDKGKTPTVPTLGDMASAAMKELVEATADGPSKESQKIVSRLDLT